MKTLLTRGRNTITVSDGAAEKMMRDEPGAYVVLPEARAKRLRGLSDKMLRAEENK